MKTQRDNPQRQITADKKEIKDFPKLPIFLFFDTI
jgi:hypothetical protein